MTFTDAKAKCYRGLSGQWVYRWVLCGRFHSKTFDTWYEARDFALRKIPDVPVL